MSRAIAIKNPAGRHIGFILSAPNYADPESGVEHGDCIFRSLPRDGDDFDDPLAEELLSLQQQGEFEFRMTTSDAGQTYEVRAESPGGYDVVIEPDGEGLLYRITEGGLREMIGKAQLAEPRNSQQAASLNGP